MASLSDSHITDIKYFDYTIVEDHITCCNKTQQKTIFVDDIVCIIPEPEDGETGYTLLFIRDESDSVHPDALTDSTYLESICLSSLPPTLSQYVSTPDTHRLHQDSDSTDIHIVVSTASGTGLAKAVFSRILQPLLAHIGLDKYELHQTESPHTVTQLCHSKFIPQAERRVPQLIIMLSGDGGLNDIIDAFYCAAKSPVLPPDVALIPVGTGNAMASSIGLLTHPRDSFLALLRGELVSMSAFAATFSPSASYITDQGRGRVPVVDLPNIAENQPPTVYGVVVASWGIHAALVADSDTVEYRRFGSDRFRLAAKELLYPSAGGEPHKYHGTITLVKHDCQEKNDRVIMEQREHMYVLATMVPNLEKDFMISPKSTGLDGLLRMIHFGPLTPQRAMQIMSSAYQRGKHVEDESVLYAEIEGFRIDFHEEEERWRRVCIDGKIISVEEGGWMEVRKEKRQLIRILSPKPIAQRSPVLT